MTVSQKISTLLICHHINTLSSHDFSVVIWKTLLVTIVCLAILLQQFSSLTNLPA